MGRFFLLEFSIQKIQRGRIFLTNWQSPFEFICFFANIIEKRFCWWSSRYKNSKRQNFSLELTQSLRVYLLFCKYYREVVLLLRFSIQKFKEAEFFTRTDRFFVYCHFEFICFFANIIEKLFLMRSRYKKFKESKIF